MLNAVYSELLKLKRTFIIPMVTLFAIPILPMMNQINSGKIIEWNNYFSIIEALDMMSLNMIIFSIVTGYIYTREYTDRTASTAYSYPVGKTGVFLSKFIFSILIILYVYVLQFLCPIAVGLIVPHKALTMHILVNHLMVYIYSMLFIIALQPITIFISQISKNIVIIFIYSIFWISINVLSLNVKPEVAEIIPHSLPLLPVTLLTRNAASNMFTIPSASIICGLLTFVFGISACILYFRKSNMC